MDQVKSEPFWTVKPKPAFCVKLRHKSECGEDEKIFLNFCVCDDLPPPVQDIDEDRLAVILESFDPGSYRIPISVGEAHAEEDKSGQSCSVFDIILNEKFYSKRVVDSELFRTFLILVAIDAVEAKHELRNIDRENFVVLKNRKCIGDLQSQRIRRQPRPLIELIDDEKMEVGGTKSISDSSTDQKLSSKISIDQISRPERSTDQKLLSRISIDHASNSGIPIDQTTRFGISAHQKSSDVTVNIKSKFAASSADQISKTKSIPVGFSTPKSDLLISRYEIRKNHPTNATKITASFYIGGIKSASEIDLDIAEHRIRVVALKIKYSEDIFVPMALDAKGAKATFSADDGLLTVEIPINKGVHDTVP